MKQISSKSIENLQKPDQSQCCLSVILAHIKFIIFYKTDSQFYKTDQKFLNET